jgi:hypothetical protein
MWPELFDRYYAEYKKANNDIRKHGEFIPFSIRKDSDIIKEGRWYKVDFYIAKRHPDAYEIDELRIKQLKSKPKEIISPFSITTDSHITF